MGKVIVVLLALHVSGCSTVMPSQQSAGAEAVIRGLEEQERTALLNRDSVALQRIWAPEFIVNSPLNQISPNREVVLDLVRSGRINHSSFERRIEEIRILGNTAVVMGAETVQSANAGPPVHRRFTHVWQQRGGAWSLVARHANNTATP